MQLLVSNIGYDDYLGRLAVGRVERGTLKTNQAVVVCKDEDKTINGRAVSYTHLADELTDSMEKAIKETNRRREIQEKYNKEHNITPKTINKAIRESIRATYQVAEDSAEYKMEAGETLEQTIDRLTQEMIKFANDLDFENAAKIRDKIKLYKGN